MKKRKPKLTKRVLILVACVLLMAGAAFVGYRHWNDSVIDATDDATSLRNYKFMSDARSRGDVGLCDKIHGSIHPVKTAEPDPRSGIVYGASAQMPRLNESDAKSSCREQAQSTIDRIKYQNIVCADPSVEEYSFGTNHTYSCPTKQ